MLRSTLTRELLGVENMADANRPTRIRRSVWFVVIREA
jgi:hypothetical protein